MKLILASASPRRAEILRNAGIPFESLTVLFDELRRPGELRGDYVRRVALGKARAAANESAESGDCLFIGADTIVVANDEILGKPASEQDARRMLRLLSGTVHEVHTGVALVRRPGAKEGLPGRRLVEPGRSEGIIDETTRVTFAPLSEEEIESYIATGEPFDKAGGYAIQGIAGRYITRIDGCYFNVVGLPLARLWALLRDFGWTESQERNR
ncbi:MAG TPA: Maf family protein [Candidatus Acidoferrales bacterium]|nr:Maf family protein [Candidatus Acidoferrales bacterium]